MKVRMFTLSAGPTGIVYPGEILDVSANEASELIQGGFAQPIKEITKPMVETAAMEPAAQTTSHRFTPRRRKQKAGG